MRPIRIPNHISDLLHSPVPPTQRCEVIKINYRRLQKQGLPEVSVVIPAYNEEKNILHTLHSLALNHTKYAVEIIVVNNNSIDDTETLARACGVNCILETKQGITAARNAGLAAATGKYILNADADAIYPQHWIESMVKPLESIKVALTYGLFAFVPTGDAGRGMYFLYEYAADAQRLFKKHFREEAVNVYGFNSGFRRKQGLAVEGYNHPKGANEDGYLALKLRNAGYGKLHCVTNPKAMVWTTDRRIQMEGGFLKGVNKRIKKFFFPQTFVHARTDL